MFQRQSLNFLWIAIDYADSEQSESRQCPIPERYVDNIAATSAANPQADIFLWVDKRRHSQTEFKALDLTMQAKSNSGNLHIRDLREIPQYSASPFFNRAETSTSWRFNKHSLIWCQVDAAKFLVCFQGDYDQAFFADMDVVDIDLTSEAIQTPLSGHGMVFGVQELGDGRLSIENHLFGFIPAKRYVFEDAYRRSHGDSQNGYAHLIQALQGVFKEQSIRVEDVGFKSKFLGVAAHHPTRKNEHGMTYTNRSDDFDMRLM